MRLLPEKTLCPLLILNSNMSSKQVNKYDFVTLWGPWPVLYIYNYEIPQVS